MQRISKKVEKALDYSKRLLSEITLEDGRNCFSYIEKLFVTCRSENEKVVALLSPMLTYKKMSSHDLLYEFGGTVRDAVLMYSLQPTDETDEIYLSRISANPISRAVKIADLNLKKEEGSISEVEYSSKLDLLLSGN